MLAALVGCTHSDALPPSPQGAPGAEGLSAAILAARRDAAQVTGAAPDAFTLTSAEPVVWRDGSLGCPRDGMLYTQALVPGYRIRLQLGQREFLYHSGRAGAPVRCPPERAQPPLPGNPAS